MKICLIAEGSYPYVTGGVSSWIQSLMTSMPEHQFIIYAIGAEEETKGKFKYTLPTNLVEIREVFLDSYLLEDSKTGVNFRLKDEEKRAIKSILAGETDWFKLFLLMTSRKTKIDSVSNFMTSRDMFDIIEDMCGEQYSETPFSELYWTARSMLVPLFLLLREKVPEADLYHSVSTGYAGVIGAFGKYLYNKPFVLTEHGIYTREREEEIIKANWIKGQFKDLWTHYFYSLSHCAYLSSDQVVSLFHRNKEIQTEIGCDEAKIAIIPNGVQIEDFNFLPQKTAEEEDYINVGAVVRVVPIKDIKTMIESFAIVKREVANTKFYIFGPFEEDHEYYEECVRLVDSLGVADIYFTGSVNIKQYIGKMDVLVLSSISEGQPLAVLEGMAAGKPYVCTDVGSCSELLYGVQDGIGKAGFVVPVMNSTEMANAIVTLSSDPELRIEMGKNGYNRVRSSYTKDQFIEQYKKIYKDTRALSWRELAFN
jgi:polysaccharide biosynthesis protein PelF